MKRIVMSLGAIVFVAAAAAGATGAFFSDTETSTGNTFTAGDIDLQIDNESYITDVNGRLIFSTSTSWDMKDLTANDHFFNFSDLKPGDVGEDTISIHVGSNDAWMCAAAQITRNADEDCTEPEGTDELGQCGQGNSNTNGELASQLNFIFWVDDGDNVLEGGEATTTFLQGPLSGIGEAGKITLADSEGSILGSNTPIPGDTTFFIGKAFCFGNLGTSPVEQDGLGKTGNNGPLNRGTGITCDGSPLNNTAQTDSVVGDMQFYAVQSRNNATFTCDEDYTPTWPQLQVVDEVDNG